MHAIHIIYIVYIKYLHTDKTLDDVKEESLVSEKPASSEAGEKPAAEGATAAAEGATAEGATAEGATASISARDQPTELPFQIQVTYTDIEGAKAIRVLTQSKPVTKDRDEAEKSRL